MIVLGQVDKIEDLPEGLWYIKDGTAQRIEFTEEAKERLRV